MLCTGVVTDQDDNSTKDLMVSAIQPAKPRCQSNQKIIQGKSIIIKKIKIHVHVHVVMYNVHCISKVQYVLRVTKRVSPHCVKVTEAGQKRDDSVSGDEPDSD